jgi:hypothetical protein
MVCGVLAAALGCAGDGAAATDAAAPIRDAGSDAAGETLPAASYCDETADSYCDFYLRCGRMAVDDQATCRDVFLETCRSRYLPRYVALETAGLLRLRRDGVDACAAHLGAVACAAQRGDLDGPCRGMWEGTLPAGGSCGLDIEGLVCSAGTECVLDPSLCGVCTALAGTDQPCTAPELTCGAAAVCAEGVCRARLAVGAGCAGTDACVLGASCEGGTCVGSQVVRLGDACDAAHRCPYLTRCAGGTCRLTACLGGACASDVDCASGWCAPSGECSPLLSAGATCDSPLQCVSGSCLEDGCGAIPGVCFESGGGA